MTDAQLLHLCSNPRILVATLAASFALVTGTAQAQAVAPPAQAPNTAPTTPSSPTPAGTAVNIAPVPAAKPAAPAETSAADRATAYYHAALADSYEDMATNYGRQEYVTQAVEEYKLALNADPNSSQLQIGLAELYFRAGRAREAIQTAQELIKKDDNNLEAHKLLGRIYLRSLGQDQSQGPSQSQATPSGQVLDLAIAQFVKIVALEPKSLEDRLLLGQLYTLKHDSAAAEAQFKAGQDIEPASEDVILNLARLYAESGDLKRAADLLVAVPIDDRTPKEEFALGAAYEQLKDAKKAIAAYQRSVDMEPDNLDAVRSLGHGPAHRQPAR